MKRQFSRLSKVQKEKVESEYHGMKPEDFDETMSRAKTHRPETRSRPKRKIKAAEKRRAA